MEARTTGEYTGGSACRRFGLESLAITSRLVSSRRSVAEYRVIWAQPLRAGRPIPRIGRFAGQGKELY